MKRAELLQFHEQMCRQAREIMAAKNHDYSGGDGATPFANFEVVEQFGVCSTLKGFLVRMLDKMKRLTTFANQGELKARNEGAYDACLDILNYCILLAAYLEYQRRCAAPAPQTPRVDAETVQ